MNDAPTLENPAYFERLAALESEHWWSLGVWRLASYWLDSALLGRRGLRALDVGCGTGMTAVRLAARPEIAEVTGLDPSPVALAHSRRRHGWPLVLGSALELPFENGHFDVVTCLDVFQHLPPGGDHRAASEIARVLVNQGVALIRSNGRAWSNDPSTYQLGGLIEVIKQAGLEVRRASYANCLPSLIQEVRGRLFWSGSPSHPAGTGLRLRLPHAALNRTLTFVSSAEAFVAGRLGIPLPFGHTTMVVAVQTNPA
jgi:SAM-dependent methyltransferase